MLVARQLKRPLVKLFLYYIILYYLLYLFRAYIHSSLFELCTISSTLYPPKVYQFLISSLFLSNRIDLMGKKSQNLRSILTNHLVFAHLARNNFGRIEGWREMKRKKRPVKENQRRAVQIFCLVSSKGSLPADGRQMLTVCSRLLLLSQNYCFSRYSIDGGEKIL